MAGMDEKRRWSRKAALRMALIAAPVVASGFLFVADNVYYRWIAGGVTWVLFAVAMVVYWGMDKDERDNHGKRGRV